MSTGLSACGFAGFRPPGRQHWVGAGVTTERPRARTNGLDAGPARCMLSADARRSAARLCGCGSFSKCDAQIRWAGPDWSGRRSSLRPAGVGMKRCGSTTRGQSRGDHAGYGGQTVRRPRACCVRGAHAALRWSQGADVPVAQPVVDQGEQFARRGDRGDVRAAA